MMDPPGNVERFVSFFQMIDPKVCRIRSEKNLTISLGNGVCSRGNSSGSSGAANIACTAVFHQENREVAPTWLSMTSLVAVNCDKSKTCSVLDRKKFVSFEYPQE